MLDPMTISEQLSGALEHDPPLRIAPPKLTNRIFGATASTPNPCARSMTLADRGLGGGSTPWAATSSKRHNESIDPPNYNPRRDFLSKYRRRRSIKTRRAKMAGTRVTGPRPTLQPESAAGRAHCERN